MGVIDIVLVVVYGVCALASFVANVITFKRVGRFKLSFSELVDSVVAIGGVVDPRVGSQEPADENDSYYIDKFAALAEELQKDSRVTWKALWGYLAQYKSFLSQADPFHLPISSERGK